MYVDDGGLRPPDPPCWDRVCIQIHPNNCLIQLTELIASGGLGVLCPGGMSGIAIESTIFIIKPECRRLEEWGIL